MTHRCYLRVGDDTLEEAKFFRTFGRACDSFKWQADELAQYEQHLTASVHFVARKGDPDLTDYPDRVLSLGPRGGLVIERT
jgi:hypothetical protein